MLHLISVTGKSEVFFAIEVKAESYTLSATKDFVHAMPTMLAAQYVFNVAYASKTFGAMYFMQKYLLGIDDKQNNQAKC